MSLGADASNVCLPESHPVIQLVPPLPKTPERGTRCPLFGLPKHSDSLVYVSGKHVVVRSTQTTAAPSLTNFLWRGHATTVTAARCSPSRAYIASGDAKGSLKVWSADTDEHRVKYACPAVLTGAVRDIDWDGENKRLAITGERAPTDGTGMCSKALQWDTGNTLGTMGLHLKGRATSITSKPSRPFRVVSAGLEDHKLMLHKGPPFALLMGNDAAHSKSIQVVRYNPSGTHIASAGSDRCLVVYGDGKEGLDVYAKVDGAHSATIYDVEWKDDATLLTASGDGTCKLWKLEASYIELVQTWSVYDHECQRVGVTEKPARIPVGVNQVGCTFAGDEPVSIGYNGQLSFLKSDATISTTTGHIAPIADVAWDAEKSLLYTGDTDGVVCRWEYSSAGLQPLERLAEPSKTASTFLHEWHTGAVAAVAVSNGNLLSVGWDDVLKNSADPTASSPLQAQPVAMAAGKQRAAVVTVADTLWSIGADGALGKSVKLSTPALSVAVAADDSVIYVGGKDGKIRLYDMESLESTAEFGNHRGAIGVLKLSNNGEFLAAGDEKDICVWNLKDHSAVIGPGRWCFHSQRVSALSWSSDDQILASGGADDSVFLWNPSHKMKRVHYKFCHRGGIAGIQFVDNGLRFITAGADAAVQVWDVTDDAKAKFGL